MFVLNYKKPAFWIIIVAIITPAAIWLGLATNPREDEVGHSGVNAVILDIDKDTHTMTVEGIDENSIIGDQCVVAWEKASLITVATNSGPTMLTIDDFSVGDYVVLFIGEVQESYPTQAKARTIQLQPNEEQQDIVADFTNATITEWVNYEEINQINFSDQESINKLHSLLLLGELTNRKSVNDSPNQENYFHVALSGKEEVQFYIYQDNSQYYLEQPYSGIFEINIDTLNQILTIFNLKSSENEEGPSEDVTAFLNEISSSFQIDGGIARFIVPAKMPKGYEEFQLSVNVNGFMPMGEDGSNMSLHAFEKENEEGNWQLGKEYTEKMLDSDVPDNTQINASFYLTEKESGASVHYTSVSKVFPLRNDSFRPAVSISRDNGIDEVVFSDRFNDKLALKCRLPSGWAFKASDDNFTTVEILADDRVIGSLIYNTFKLHQDENGDIPYRSVYGDIMLGSMASWDNEYCELYKDKTICVATCRPWHNLSFPGVSNAAAPTIYSKGILAYNIDASKYIAISLEEDSVTDALWQSIADSVKLDVL